MRVPPPGDLTSEQAIAFLRQRLTETPGGRLDRYAAALHSTRLEAIVAVADAEQAELRAIVDRLKKKRESYQRFLDVAIDEENLRWLPAIIGALDSILEAKP